MNAYEKANLLKDTIKQLYENEGRSISYICRLLKIDRHTLSKCIYEWDFHQYGQEKRKIMDFLKRKKEFVIACIKSGDNMRTIERKCKIGQAFFEKVIEYDKDISDTIQNTYRTDGFSESIIDETWKDVLGYPDYQVSDYGRVRHKNKLVKPILNTLHDRFYVGMVDENGKRHNLILSRVVAHSFCSGYSKEKNTVNHKNGNTHDNRAENLEWVSQSENNKHSYDVLKRSSNKCSGNKKIIKYQNKYEFKTVSAFARFIGKSETQARRYLDNPEKYGIKIILIN